ncbi:MAG: hypothetical protein NT033_08740 [Candidatus Omnitrophica bacterium]|nr:hypothetical protein [Candidatus Omnitrophota bacterium]
MEGDLLVWFAWKGSLTPEEAERLIADINAQVTLSIATFDLKSAGPGRAVAVVRGMHLRLSDARQSALLLDEFIGKINKVATAYKIKVFIENE